MNMAHPRHLSGCIYCGGSGPFSDEHVISAGLGGDDRAWLLEKCVCAYCNTKIFGPLETKFLRASLVAMSRLFLQPRTRNRGSQTGLPSVQPRVSFHRDATTGLLLEADLLAGGSPIILPQVAVKGATELVTTGTDADVVGDFLKELESILSGDLTLIEKTRDGFEVAYQTTPLIWDGSAYICGPQASASRPPKGGIWLEGLVRPETSSSVDILFPRVFKRSGGQLVCRIESPELAAQFLSILRANPQLVDPAAVSGSRPAEAQAEIHQRFQFDMAVYDRLLTKIGINLAAKLLGIELVRDAAFDFVVGYACTGEGGVFKVSAENSVAYANLLGPALRNRHVFGLFPAPGPSGGCALVFFARLYGGPLEALRLAELPHEISCLGEGLIVHVDYEEQRIERLTVEEHAARLAAELYG